MEVNEKELHRRAIAGDDDAFLAVMQLYKEPLLRTALAFLRNENDAIEALQEVTYRAYKKIATVKDSNYLKTWLIRIMMNYCQDQLKLRKRFTVDASGLETVSAEDISYLEMREALATLSNEEQRLIYLKYFQEVKIKDIAQSENIPEGTVKSRLHKTMRTLRSYFEDKGGSDHV
ncbi:RNA polymerase sigma factor [Sporosarcina ureae]|uniref:RNA polymerase sigma factor n=1 Tax=Sporosarcina ureae TaxID=1571 RepID=UPI0026E9CB1E|nr:RNA polymerase sigma factor [Sporosarcina ureae]